VLYAVSMYVHLVIMNCSGQIPYFQERVTFVSEMHEISWSENHNMWCDVTIIETIGEKLR
jgi:hypothetical protein